MKYLKNHSRLALGYFLIAALLGLILRSFYVLEINKDKNVHRYKSEREKKRDSIVYSYT